MQTGVLKRDGQPWVDRVRVATSLYDRMRGLLGCSGLPAGAGLLIEHCGSIHTVGMRFPIDVVFIDRHWRVCRVYRNIRPGRLWISGGWRARRALEVAAGWLAVPIEADPVITLREV